MAEEFGSNAKRIKMTVRFDRATYAKLHERSVRTDATHNRIINRAVDFFLESEKKAKRA